MATSFSAWSRFAQVMSEQAKEGAGRKRKSVRLDRVSDIKAAADGYGASVIYKFSHKRAMCEAISHYFFAQSLFAILTAATKRLE
ncbi:uncharacterized protein L3040_007457 [Drepanopeziza brunnea f. sp. 'multigermtubi']|uniref:uncharacterized protein n=1 Tax=Drepanopeziza brunnea f. sp. 'multigermtubi' TaxID=698441 RepID=UPI00239A673A|nr:hypothetical protein L3040_007457 [Drepanopeziza brunnea f. sp. 'multigermtubi']